MFYLMLDGAATILVPYDGSRTLAEERFDNAA
jgi:hypothetical protein